MRAVNRNVFVLGLVSLFADVSSDMVVPLLPAFLVTLGGGPAVIGLVEGAAEATASLFKYLSGRWSDRLSRLLPLTATGYALAALVRPLLSVATAPWHVLALRCTDRVGKGLRSSPRDKLLAGSVATGQLAEAFSFHLGMDHLGAAIGPLVATALLIRWPGDVRRVFLWAAVPGAFALVALFLVRERPMVTGPGAAQVEAAPPAGSVPRKLGGIPAPLLVSIGLFALGNSADALLLLRALDFGVPLVQAPLLWVALHGVRSITSWPLGRLGDRLGRRRALAWGWCWYAVCYAGFALGHGLVQAWVLFVVYGFVAALTEGNEKALVVAAVPPERRGLALGWYNLVTGLGLLGASVLAGQLWERVSPQAALFTGAVFALLGSLVLVMATPADSSTAAPRAPVPATPEP